MEAVVDLLGELQLLLLFVEAVECILFDPLDVGYFLVQFGLDPMHLLVLLLLVVILLGDAFELRIYFFDIAAPGVLLIEAFVAAQTHKIKLILCIEIDPDQQQIFQRSSASSIFSTRSSFPELYLLRLSPD